MGFAALHPFGTHTTSTDNHFNAIGPQKGRARNDTANNELARSGVIAKVGAS